MRMIQYDVELDENKMPYLVKEKGYNYPLMKMQEPQLIVNMMNEVFNLRKKAEEHVYYLMADTKVKPLKIFEISKGTVNQVHCNAREILMRALLCGCVCLVMIHNHPSGDITASEDDINCVKKMKEASSLLGIKLVDSIIIGGDDYLSFREDGLI